MASRLSGQVGVLDAILRRSHCGLLAHIAALRAVPRRYGLGVCGTFGILAVQRGQALVAQEGSRHRSLLLVRRAGSDALWPHRLYGSGHDLSLRDQHLTGHSQLLRPRPWADLALALLVSGVSLSGRHRFGSLLDSSR